MNWLKEITWSHLINEGKAFDETESLFRASLIAQLVKNSPAMQETLVWFPGWEDPLEKW